MSRQRFETRVVARKCLPAMLFLGHFASGNSLRLRCFAGNQKGNYVRLTAYRSPGRPAVALALLLMGLAGCAFVPSLPTVEPVIEPRLPPDPKPAPAPPIEAPTAAAPRPAPAPPAPVSPEPVEAPTVAAGPLRVAVLLSARTAAFENVANALAAQLEDADIYDLTDRSLTPREVFEAVEDAGTDVVVAIGLRATTFASGFDDIPVVFSQVFNADQVGEAAGMKGVSVLPPLELQLEAWLALNPELSSIGAIVGHGHERLIDEATTAAAAKEVRFQHRIAQSDRETLYLFTRLVPDIDGFWLFPDNRVLSIDVLRQMLAYAARHRVQVAVFNDALLPLGATISATSVNEDIAETVVGVARKMLSGDAEEVPSVVPLNEVRIRTNDDESQRVAQVDDATEGTR